MINALTDIGNLNVLVVGDLMIDRYYKGQVSRISPEAPVPIVEWQGQEDRLGGAANVALSVALLGANVNLCGVIGKDYDSESFCRLLEKNNIKNDLILQTANKPTTIKTRVIANKQHLLRLDKESKEPLNKFEENRLLEKLTSFFSLENKIDVVILQDYNKGVLTRTLIDFLIKKAKRVNAPITVDPKYQNFWEYKGVSLFKPNLKEVQDVLPFPVSDSKDSLLKAASYLQSKLQCEYLFISLSEKGIFAASNEKASIFPTQSRKVADVCGAGDGVIAIASLALAMGLKIDDIALLANLVGGQIVERVGVTPIDKKILHEELLKIQLSENSNFLKS